MPTVPNCGKCQLPCPDQELMTACRLCHVSYHLGCVGMTKKSSQYGCFMCYTHPGNKPEGKRNVTSNLDGGEGGGHVYSEPSNPAGAASAEPEPSTRDLMSVLLRLAASLERRQTPTAAPAGAVPKKQRKTRPAPPSSDEDNPEEADQDGVLESSREQPVDVTMVRSSSDFKRCLGEVAVQHRPQKPAADSYVRAKPPPLPKLTGRDPLEWPRFITNYLESTEQYRVSNVANMDRVREAVRGGPAEVVLANTLLHSSSLADALDLLRVSYGNPETILRGLEAEVSTAPKIDAVGRGLQLLSVQTRGLVNAMSACGMEDQLRTNSLVTKLQEKLSFTLALRWGEYLGNRTPGVDDFDQFLQRELGYALKAGQQQVRITQSAPALQKKVMTVAEVSSDEQEPVVVATVRLQSSPPAGQAGSAEGPAPKCLQCGGPHRLDQCGCFLRLDPQGRCDAIRTLRLCVRCLLPNGARCRCERRRCSMDGCPYNHHALLHAACNLRFTQAHPSPQVVGTSVSSSTDSLYKFVPVTLRHGGRQVDVWAFVDEGSGPTMMDPQLACELNIRVPQSAFSIRWADSAHTITDRTSQRCHLQIVRANGTCLNIRDVRTLRGLDLPAQTLTQAEIDELFPEGGGPAPYAKVKPRLLIGLNNAHLAAPLSRGRLDAATGRAAVDTPLGWIVYGGGDRGADLAGLHFRVHHAREVDDQLSRVDLDCGRPSDPGVYPGRGASPSPGARLVSARPPRRQAREGTPGVGCRCRSGRSVAELAPARRPRPPRYTAVAISRRQSGGDSGRRGDVPPGANAAGGQGHTTAPVAERSDVAVRPAWPDRSCRHNWKDAAARGVARSTPPGRDGARRDPATVERVLRRNPGARRRPSAALLRPNPCVHLGTPSVRGLGQGGVRGCAPSAWSDGAQGPKIATGHGGVLCDASPAVFDPADGAAPERSPRTRRQFGDGLPEDGDVRQDVVRRGAPERVIRGRVGRQFPSFDLRGDGPGHRGGAHPHHFLHGGSRAPHHGGVVMDLEGNELRRTWRLAQQLADHFWARFAREVIPQLNLRTRWFRRSEPLRVGDLVMVPSETRRGIWERGLVTQVFSKPGDTQVRQVRVFVHGKEFLRPAAKIAKLDVQANMTEWNCDKTAKTTNPPRSEGAGPAGPQ